MPIDLISLAQQPIIELFTLSEFDDIGTIFRFTSYRECIWLGQTWTHIDCKTQGFEYNSRQLPQPKLIVANTLGYIGQLVAEYNNLENAELVRYRTVEGMIWANSADLITTEIYHIEQKVSENPEAITFELSAIPIENRQLPSSSFEPRYCPFVYRDPATCGYTGPPISTPDKCKKTLGACRQRFGNDPLPARIFPGVQIE